jgi:long-chain acyl-CoA synthetase
LDKQSIEQPGGERISHYCKDGQLLAYRFEDAKTLYESFIRGKNVSGNGECLGWREKGETMYKWLSYSQVEESFMNFGSGLAHVGIPPGQDSFIGVYAANCIQWTITELSSHAYSRIIVALYDTLGHEAITHIINQGILAIFQNNNDTPILV